MAADVAAPTAGYSRVVVGVDGSPESSEAARQAARLLADGGTIVLVAAYDVAPAVAGTVGTGVPIYLDPEAQEQAAHEALRATRDAVPALAGAETRAVSGRAFDALVEAAGEGHETLVAVGTHGTGRIAGLLLGSVTTELLHRAPGAVLVARAAGEDFPARIVVGVDGSPASAAAHAVARALAERSGAELHPLIARGGKGVDGLAAVEIAGHAHDDVTAAPVDALAAASQEADLVVVGSRGLRGLHGLKALGSVSERVAHGAASSVLVVRAPAA